MNELIWLLVFLIIIYFLLLWAWKRWWRKRWSKADLKLFAKNWQRIQAEKDLRMKILEADKLLDLMLKKRQLKGSLADKLKMYGQNFSDLDGLWKAHKLRNKLAHELDFTVGLNQSKEAMNKFGQAFKDLGLLD